MDKKQELKGILKELITDEVGTDITALQEKAAIAEEANIKVLEDNKELKTQLDAMQEKTFKLAQNTGTHEYTFKGYDTTKATRNFKISCSKAAGDEAAEIIIKALTSGNTGAYAIPVEYSNALLGLAELSSFGLSECRVIQYPGEVLKMPVKGTKATVDAQAYGTANAEAATTLGQLTFTIDKRIGGYETIYNNVLKQANFDVVGQLVEPFLAESIGQNIDGEIFSKTEFTTDISTGGTASATISGALADGSITYSKLMDLEFDVEAERGLTDLCWMMPRTTFKHVVKLTDTNDYPLFNRDLSTTTTKYIDGYPVHIVPAIASDPADGALVMAFGSPKHYIIAINDGMTIDVNPYVLMKEGQTQIISSLSADGNIVSANAFATLKRSD